MDKMRTSINRSIKQAVLNAGERAYRVGRFRAFSLVELLIVVAIVGILMGLAIPAFTSVAQNTALMRGGDDVANMVVQAAQEARTRNRNVEVRFIKMPSPEGDPDAFRAVQLWAQNIDGGDMTAGQRLVLLPNGIELSETDLSPPLESTAGTMSVRGTNRQYAALVFRANGEVWKKGSGSTLAKLDSTNSMLTVVLKRDAEQTNLPANFFSIYINPQTGASRVFRP